MVKPRENGNLVSELIGAVGPSNVLVGPDTQPYCEDWTRRWIGHSESVVLPGNDREVQRVIATFTEKGVAFVPQGGNTSLVAGSVPLGGEAVLSLRRLDEIRVIPSSTPEVIAGAGVSLSAIQSAAPPDWEFPIDLAARDYATVGGMTSTNAGGTRSVRYGRFNRHIRGFTAVLPDASVINCEFDAQRSSRERDIFELLVGGEGIFGVITEARLRFVPRCAERITALVGLRGVDQALDLTVRLLAAIESLEAVEYIDQAGMRLHCDSEGIPCPVRESSCYLLIECASQRDPFSELAGIVNSAVDDDCIAVATGLPSRLALWRIRDDQPELISRLGRPHKYDLGIPLEKASSVLATLHRLVLDYKSTARCFVFGHVGVGDFHVNVIGLNPDDTNIDHLVLEQVCAEGGSAAAEHGIGRAKVAFASRSIDPRRLARMQTAKHALDPRDLCNPNVLLPLGDTVDLKGVPNGSRGLG